MEIVLSEVQSNKVPGPFRQPRILTNCHYNSYSSEYRVAQPPRVVLNKLEELGYRVVSSGGVGQTCIWTMYCESPKEPWKTGQV